MTSQLEAMLARGGTDWKRLVFAMACGKLEEAPFTQEMIEERRRAVIQWCASRGIQVKSDAGDRRQKIQVRTLQAFLQATGDPDACALDAYAVGVRLGVGCQMERTPALFEEKTKWTLPYDDTEIVEAWEPDYRSATSDVLEAKLAEARFEGKVIDCTVKVARETYGSRLAVGALGLVQEGQDKWRLVWDGTHGIGVNTRTKQLDRVPHPSVSDIAAVMQVAEEEGEYLFGLALDYEGAHNLVQVHHDDWGLQACTEEQLDGELKEDTMLSLHTCGTFGVATAGYWWGRLGAMLTRACHMMLGPSQPLWLLLFADDKLALGRTRDLHRAFPLLLFTILIFGGPLKWAKVKGGLHSQLIGYWLDVQRFMVGISLKMREWVLDWLGAVLKAGRVDRHKFKCGLGRLSFVCGALVFDRPFLAPLFPPQAPRFRPLHLEVPALADRRADISPTAPVGGPCQGRSSRGSARTRRRRGRTSSSAGGRWPTQRARRSRRMRRGGFRSGWTECRRLGLTAAGSPFG